MYGVIAGIFEQLRKRDHPVVEVTFVPSTSRLAQSTRPCCQAVQVRIDTVSSTDRVGEQTRVRVEAREATRLLPAESRSASDLAAERAMSGTPVRRRE